MLGRHIIELRKRKGLTQTELAKLMGISRSSLSLYEIEKRTPDIDTISNLASLFNVPVDYLLGIGVFENWNILLENKAIVIHQISKQAQQLSVNIKDGIDDLSFAKLVYAFDIHININKDGTIGVSATDPIPTYTENYFSNTPSENNVEKEILSLYRASTSEEKEEIINLLNSFCSLKKKDKTKILGKCYELEDMQSSVAADDSLKKTGTANQGN